MRPHQLGIQHADSLALTFQLRRFPQVVVVAEGDEVTFRGVDPDVACRRSPNPATAVNPSHGYTVVTATEHGSVMPARRLDVVVDHQNFEGRKGLLRDRGNCLMNCLRTIERGDDDRHSFRTREVRARSPAGLPHSIGHTPKDILSHAPYFDSSALNSSANWRRSRLLRNTGWGILGQLSGSAANAASLILVLAVLDPAEFGRFASTVALMLLLGPFSSSGAGHLLVKRVNSGGTEQAADVGRAFVQTLLGGVFMTCVLVTSRSLVLPQASLLLLLLTGCSELVFLRTAATSKQAGQATEQLWISASISLFSGLTRLAAATVFYFGGAQDSAESWATHYAVSALATMVFATVLLWRQLGRIRLVLPSVADIREGLMFSASSGASFLKNDADKFLLLRLGFAGPAGIYGAAYRLVGLALVPINALISASYASFFRAGTIDHAAARGLAVRLSRSGALLGGATGLALFLGADLISAVLGERWAETESAVRWMSPLPILVALQWFGGNALTGSGNHGTRTVILVAGSVVNVLANLVLIPIADWRGALAGTLMTDLGLTIALWWALLRLDGRPTGRPASEVPTPDVGS